MANEFDPYYSWLAIPPAEQPPDHYRLLGISRFETNLDAIANAADQRMVYLRTYQSGKHGAASQKLLNEVAAAKLILLDLSKKGPYDQQLHAKHAAAIPAPPQNAYLQQPAVPFPGARFPQPLPPHMQPMLGPGQTAGPAPWSPAAQPAAQQGTTQQVPLIDTTDKLKGKKKSSLLPIIGGVSVLALGAALYFVFGRTKPVDSTNLAKNTPIVETGTNSTANNNLPIETVDSKKAEVPSSNNPPTPPAVTPDPATPTPPTTPTENTTTPAPPASSTEVKPPKPPVTPDEPKKTELVQPDPPGFRLRFAGKHSIKLANSKELAQFKENFTAETWVRFADESESHGLFGTYFLNPGADPPSGWFVALAAEKELFLQNTYAKGNNWRQWRAPISSPGSLWHHVAFVAEPEKEYRMYWDGMPVLQQDWPPEMSQPGLAFWVGMPASNPFNYGFSGEMCAFRLSNGARYANKFTPPKRFENDQSTLALLNFSINRGNVISDSSGQDHHGNIQGAQWFSFSSLDEPISEVTTVTAKNSTKMPADPGTDLSTGKKPITGNRAPVPTEEERKPRLVSYNKKYKEPYEKGKKYTDRLAVVEGVLSDVRQIRDDQIETFVMYDQARAWAIELIQVGLAMRAIDEMSELFEIPALTMKMDALRAVSEKLSSTDQRRMAYEAALALARTGMETEKFDDAAEAIKIAGNLSTRITDKDAAKIVSMLKGDIARQKQNWDDVQKSLETLKAAPDDASANLIVGKHRCFSRGEWENNLHFLAKCGDEKIIKAAQTDMAARDDALGQYHAAQAWEQVAAALPKEPREHKIAVQRRAFFLYNSALPTLTGDERTVAAKQVEALAPFAYNLHTVVTVTQSSGTNLEVHPGLIGRVFVNGKDAGLLVKYDPATLIDEDKLRRILTEAGGTPSTTAIELYGMVSFTTSVSLNFIQRLDQANGKLAVMLAGKYVGNVVETVKTDRTVAQAIKGDHQLVWQLKGDVRQSSFRIADTTNNTNVMFYYTKEMLEKVRRTSAKGIKVETKKELSLSPG